IPCDLEAAPPPRPRVRLAGIPPRRPGPTAPTERTGGAARAPSPPPAAPLSRRHGPARGESAPPSSAGSPPTAARYGSAPTAARRTPGAGGRTEEAGRLRSTSQLGATTQRKATPAGSVSGPVIRYSPNEIGRASC